MFEKLPAVTVWLFLSFCLEAPLLGNFYSARVMSLLFFFFFGGGGGGGGGGRGGGIYECAAKSDAVFLVPLSKGSFYSVRVMSYIYYYLFFIFCF